MPMTTRTVVTTKVLPRKAATLAISSGVSKPDGIIVPTLTPPFYSKIYSATRPNTMLRITAARISAKKVRKKPDTNGEAKTSSRRIVRTSVQEISGDHIRLSTQNGAGKTA
jgi:hypothetical protein